MKTKLQRKQLTSPHIVTKGDAALESCKTISLGFAPESMTLKDTDHKDSPHSKQLPKLMEANNFNLYWIQALCQGCSQVVQYILICCCLFFSLLRFWHTETSQWLQVQRQWKQQKPQATNQRGPFQGPGYPGARLTALNHWESASFAHLIPFKEFQGWFPFFLGFPQAWPLGGSLRKLC